MQGKVEDDRKLLSTYGPKLNEVLQGRAGKAIQAEKEKGASFQTKYLLSNPKAVKTSSGLIYNEIIAGVGAQPTLASKVKVVYKGIYRFIYFAEVFISIFRSIIMEL
jgi:FKBP-type peptidyl-prolyl cis-trans isomerase